MECPNCKNPLSAQDTVCRQCGALVPQYDAPEGFLYDKDSGMYYRMEYTPEGQAVGATWFDSISGEYQQVAYDTPPQEEAPQEISPLQEPVMPQEATPQSAEASAPSKDISVQMEADSAAIPEGFVQDASSGYYYQESQAVDNQTGQPLRAITWFYPQTGQYERVEYPLENPQAPTTQAEYAAVGAQTPRLQQKKIIWIAVGVVVLLLLLGLGVLCWKMGWLPQQQTNRTAPSATVTTTQKDDETTTQAVQENAQTTQRAEEDITSSQSDTASQAEDATPNDTLAINSLEDLQTALLQLKIKIAAGTVTEQEQQAFEQAVEQFIEVHPEQAAQIEQVLATQDTAATQQEPAEEAQPSLRNWEQCELTVSASSTLPPSANYDYTAANILDGDANTAWVEGAAGYGIGEWVMLRTVSGETAHLQELRIRTGYQRTDTTYFANARVKDIAVEFSDGSRVNYTLADDRAWQSIPLEGTTDTSSVKIIIRSIYAGSKYQDTCLGGVVCR